MSSPQTDVLSQYAQTAQRVGAGVDRLARRDDLTERERALIEICRDCSRGLDSAVKLLIRQDANLKQVQKEVAQLRRRQ